MRGFELTLVVIGTDGIGSCKSNFHAIVPMMAPKWCVKIIIDNNVTIEVIFVYLLCCYRFIILRRRPTCRKVCFAGLVLLAEFIALIPSIFPALEGTKAHSNDGGASGLAGVLWPLCYFLGFVSTSNYLKKLIL